ncbi:MAG TPA: nuclear transport factor 2 family protein [Solirubrobacteraceae bacterium]|nr:nuclear transport factor 2 family protein [Solirubrobacteraceae bacterium]
MNNLEHKLAIQELVARYNMAWDAEDPSGVSACFTTAGVFVDAVGGEHAGREEIEAFVRASTEQFGRMRHITSTHLVEFAGDQAALHRCYVVFVSHPQGERVLDTGAYEDQVELSEGEWRFARRIVRFD